MEDVVSIVQRCADEIEGAALTWPSSSARAEDLAHFADGLIGAVLRARAYKTPSRRTLQGGTPKHAYNAKSFVRLVCLLIEGYCPHAFSRIAMSDIARWCPDQNEYAAACIPDAAVGAVVLKRLGMAPLLFHCWCCLLNQCDGTELNGALGAEVTSIWEAVLDFESGKEKYPPMTKGILESCKN